jgi:hypothetical protein
MSDEQQEANRGVAVALEEWVSKLPDRTEAGGGVGMLGDWMAVVCMVDVREDGVPVCQYYLAMRDGNMLPHVAAGLLSRGLDELAASEEG